MADSLADLCNVSKWWLIELAGKSEEFHCVEWEHGPYAGKKEPLGFKTYGKAQAYLENAAKAAHDPVEMMGTVVPKSRKEFRDYLENCRRDWGAEFFHVDGPQNHADDPQLEELPRIESFIHFVDESSRL